MTLEPEDVQGLKHYGVAGMHWGTRKGKAMAAAVNKSQGTGAGSVAKAVGKGYMNYIKHPVISTAQSVKNSYAHPIMTATSPVTMLKKTNMDVENSVKRRKAVQSFNTEHRANIKNAKKMYKASDNSSSAKAAFAKAKKDSARARSQKMIAFYGNSSD